MSGDNKNTILLFLSTFGWKTWREGICWDIKAWVWRWY